MRPLRVLAAIAAGAVLLLGPAGQALACPGHGDGSAIRSARAATAKYHRLALAQQDGYSILADTAGISCIADEMGAMGVHYVDGDLVADPALDVRRPEAVVYAPDRHGRLHLAALEYVVIKADWEARPHRHGANRDAAPRLFGRAFDLTEAPNRYGLPAFYSLHAWVWRDNPAGTFAMWNPRVRCAKGQTDAATPGAWLHGR